MRRGWIAALSVPVLAALAFAAGQAPKVAAQTGTARLAMLVRGADSVRGLPFFPPNALAALVGAYRPQSAVSVAAPQPGEPGAAGVDETTVWYTRETLVLGPAWKRTGLVGSEAYLMARPRGAVILLKQARYYLFFELPVGAEPGDKDRLSFVRAFDRKFLAFFNNAATDAELSFPAYVDF